MDWVLNPPQQRRPDLNFTILARFSLPASELKPESLRRSEEYEQSIFRDS